MRKVVGAINMTLDGYCDHTAMIADEEIHQHYADLVKKAGVLLYGRVTYMLMESYWPLVAKNPTSDRATDEFAVEIDSIDKVVFSETLTNLEWKSARIAQRSLSDEVLALKQNEGRDILVGSRSIIVSLINLNLVDQIQLCIHPVLAGGGLQLFEKLKGRTVFQLISTKSFSGGAMLLTYEPKRN